MARKGNRRKWNGSSVVRVDTLFLLRFIDTCYRVRRINWLPRAVAINNNGHTSTAARIRGCKYYSLACARVVTGKKTARAFVTTVYIIIVVVLFCFGFFVFFSVAHNAHLLLHRTRTFCVFIYTGVNRAYQSRLLRICASWRRETLAFPKWRQTFCRPSNRNNNIVIAEKVPWCNN